MHVTPIPVPSSGPVEKLKMEVAAGEVEVFIHQTRWPRQPQNPNWRIEVRGIDGRYDPETHQRIRLACEDVARIYLRRWLKRVAPLVTIETVTWHELVTFATRKKFRALSPYQIRQLNGRGTFKYPIASEISYDPDFKPSKDDEVEE